MAAWWKRETVKREKWTEQETEAREIKEEKWRWLVSRGTAERMTDERRRDGAGVRQKRGEGRQKKCLSSTHFLKKLSCWKVFRAPLAEKTLISTLFLKLHLWRGSLLRLHLWILERPRWGSQGQHASGVTVRLRLEQGGPGTGRRGGQGCSWGHGCRGLCFCTLGSSWQALLWHPQVLYSLDYRHSLPLTSHQQH